MWFFFPSSLLLHPLTTIKNTDLCKQGTSQKCSIFRDGLTLWSIYYDLALISITHLGE